MELSHGRAIASLAIQAGKLLHKPHIPLLREDNTRIGFFELDQFQRVRDHLPSPLDDIVEFACITGWRIASEILSLEWRQVDFAGGEIRLDSGRTKNREARVFPMTDDLRALLERRSAQHQELKRAGHIVPFVFVRMIAEGRGGPLRDRIVS